MIYLVIGNHQTLSGVWEQVEITLRTFREMDVQIRIASRIQSGHINILIEDFNSHIVEEMSKVKVNNPDTQYVLYVTEYLTQNSNAHVTLNCFSRTSVWVRRLFRWEYKLLSDDYNMYQGGTKANQIKAKVRTLLEPLLSFCANFAGSNYGNEVMMARREACLDKIRGLFSLCISTTEAVLNGYDKYCDCPLKYLPVFIDKNRMYSNRSKSKKYPAIVFSGRMTHHREVVSKHIGLKLLNGYPLEAGEAWKSLSQDTEFKLDRLELEETAYGKMEALRFSDEKQTRLNGGVLINPSTNDTRFELTKMDPLLYSQVKDLKDNQMSMPLLDNSDNSVSKYKILKISNRFDEHVADFSQDYVKIKDLALTEKQLKSIKKWMEEKIGDTYINVNSDTSYCNFAYNWKKD